MKKVLLLLGLLIFSVSALAADYTYQKGRDRWVSVACTDALVRADGEVLPPEEIARVILYVDPVYGDTTDPLHIITMEGGCGVAGTANVDLSMFPMRTDLIVYGVTQDIDGRTSITVTPIEETKSFRIEPSPPGPPGRMRIQRIEINL